MPPKKADQSEASNSHQQVLCTRALQKGIRSNFVVVFIVCSSQHISQVTVSSHFITLSHRIICFKETNIFNFQWKWVADMIGVQNCLNSSVTGDFFRVMWMISWIFRRILLLAMYMLMQMWPTMGKEASTAYLGQRKLLNPRRSLLGKNRINTSPLFIFFNWLENCVLNLVKLSKITQQEDPFLIDV